MLYQTQSPSGEQIILGGNGALVASKSMPGTWYAIRPQSGILTCECRGFTHRGKCRHVEAVKAIIREAESKIEQAKAATVAPVVKNLQHERDTAILAGPAIDPPLFPEERSRQAKKMPTFEELFGAE